MRLTHCLSLSGLLASLFTTPVFAAGDERGYPGSSDEFKPVYALIEAEKYRQAHQKLLDLKVGNREADRFNLLGFTARKSGDYEDAGRYYEQALTIDPEHLGALEYQGELFITLGQIDRAKQNLAKIDEACWFSCSEEDQ